MAGEIASAFVRIRPNMTGFQSQVEAGTRSSFSNIGKIVGIALSGAAAFEFGKKVVTGAADLQKQVEAVKEEFGQAGDALVTFGEKGAKAFGISADLADTTSARFGVLFKTLGVGPDLSAKMALGFEKLAGSIATIRNVDPSTLLANLPSAVAGNVRALRTLGVATNSAQIQGEALRLGLISQINQALTPAQKAVAIYGIAMGHLDEFQKQAASHSTDLATEQRKLSAEWANAKDELGSALLPEIDKLVTFVADKLPSGIELVKTKFGEFRQTLEQVLGPIGGVKTVVGALFALFAVNKISQFASAIRNDLVQRGMYALSQSARQASADVSASTDSVKADAASVDTAFQQVGVEGSDAFGKVGTSISGVGALLKTLQAEAVTTLEKVKAASLGVATSVRGSTASGAIASPTSGFRPAAIVNESSIATTTIGANLAKVVSDAEEAAKKSAEAINQGFESSTIDEYGARLHEVINRVTDISKETKKAGEEIKGAVADSVTGAKSSVEAIATTASASSAAVTSVATDAAAAGTQVQVAAAKADTALADVGVAAKEAGASIGESISAGSRVAAASLSVLQAAGARVLAGLEAGVAEAEVALDSIKLTVIGLAETIKTVLIQSAIFLLIIGLTEAYQRNEKFRSAVNDLASDVRDRVVPAVESFIAKVKPVAVTVFDKVRAAVVAATPLVKELYDQFIHLGSGLKAVAAAGAGIIASLLVFGVTGSAVGALVVLIGTLTVAFVEAYKHSQAFRDGVHTALNGVKSALEAIKPAAKVMLSAFEALSPTLKLVTVGVIGLTAALFALDAVPNVITLIVLAVAALAIGFKEAYDHSATFRRVINDIGNVVTQHLLPALGAFKDLVVAAFTAAEPAIKHFLTLLAIPFVASIKLLEVLWSKFGGTLVAVIKNHLQAMARIVGDVLDAIRGVFQLLTAIIEGKWGAAWKAIKLILSSALDIMKTSLKTWGTDIELIMKGIWHAIEKVFLEGIEKVVGLLAKLPNFHVHIPHVGNVGFDNPFKKADSDLKKYIDGLGKTSKTAAAAAASKVVTATKAASDTIHSAGADLRGDFKSTVTSAAVNAIAGNADALSNELDALQTKLVNTVKKQAAQVQTMKSQLSQLRDNLKQALKQEVIDIHDAVESAKQNLDTISSTIATDIGDILQRPIDVANQKIAALQNLQNLTNLRNEVALPHGEKLSLDPTKARKQLEALAKGAGSTARNAIEAFSLQYQSAALQHQQDHVSLIKDAATRRIGDLAYAYNTGVITAKKFNAGIRAEFKRDHVSLGLANKELGPAFAGQLSDNLKGLTAQVKALEAGPKRPGLTGSDPNIVKPLDVMRKDQNEIKRIQREIGNKQVRLQTLIHGNTAKTATILGQIHALQKAGALDRKSLTGKQSKTAHAVTGATG